MKKLLLLSALALGALTASAQTFNVTVMDEPIQNGDEVVVDCLMVDVQEVMGQVFTSYQINPEVRMTADQNCPVQITVTNTSKVETPSLQFCWPDNCQAIPLGGSLTREGVANEKDRLEIDSTWFQELPEGGVQLSCTVNIVPTNNPSNNFKFDLVMNGVEAGIGDIVDDDAIPVYYNLNGVKVANPDHGIFIMKKGAKTVKVVK